MATPDISAADLNWPSRDEAAAQLREKLATLEARIAMLQENDRRMCGKLMEAGATIARLTAELKAKAA